MSDQTHPVAPAHEHDEKIPRLLVRAMFGLTLAALALVTFARVTDRPLVSQPTLDNVVAERVVFLQADMSGAATVLDETGTVIADLGPDQGGFIGGVTRVIARERTKHRVALDGPVTLIRTAEGRVAITDPSTGWRADLMGFGADNARAFARLLD